MVRQPVRPRVQLPVASAPRSSQTTATASGVRAACASNSSWRQRSGGVLGLRPVPLLQHLRAAPPPPAAAARRGALRVRRHLLQQPLQVPHHPLGGAALEQVRAVLQRRRAAPAASPPAPASGRTWRVSASASAPLQPQPRRTPASAPVAFCSANITWNSGEWLRLRSGCQLLHQLLERQVLVRVGPQRRLPHPPQQLRGSAGRPTGRRAAPAC